MNSSHLPIAVRATAAAIAVFMTFTTLNGLIAIAEPEQSQLMARNAPRHVAQVASAPLEATLVARGPSSTIDR
jgi:hypothetical protein